MTSKEFAAFRHSFDKTQKQMSELLGISLRSVQSFEQSWRTIPDSIERQVLFLIFMNATGGQKLTPCWEIEQCPSEKRVQCPAWEFHAGQVCWYINGTICQGTSHPTWKEKMKFCKRCKVFECMNFVLDQINTRHGEDMAGKSGFLGRCR